MPSDLDRYKKARVGSTYNSTLKAFFDTDVLNFVLKPCSHYVCIAPRKYSDLDLLCALGEIRTPNRLIRSHHRIHNPLLSDSVTECPLVTRIGAAIGCCSHFESPLPSDGIP